MCSSGTKSHFDSILDDKVITKAINSFKEAIDALDQKLKTIQTSTERVISNLAKGNDNLKDLKSDVTGNIKCIQKILKKVEDKPSYQLCKLGIKFQGLLDNRSSWRAQPAEQQYLRAEVGMEMPRDFDFVIPSHAERLKEVSEMQLKLRKSANKGLDSVVDWIEEAKGKAERTVKEQNEIKDDLRKQFAIVQELVVQVQQVAVKVS